MKKRIPYIDECPCCGKQGVLNFKAIFTYDRYACKTCGCDVDIFVTRTNGKPRPVKGKKK